VGCQRALNPTIHEGIEFFKRFGRHVSTCRESSASVWRFLVRREPVSAEQPVYAHRFQNPSTAVAEQGGTAE
jgi:hypothetical protein